MHKLSYTQKLPISLEKAWDFFSSPSNLKLLTPEYLSFNMTCDTSEMYPGQIITYTIRPLFNIPINWVTEITHVEKQVYFIDEQRFGPYSFWHHEHRFTAIPNGVSMADTVYYKLPFGPIGGLLNSIKVQKDVVGIFNYRNAKLEELFGVYKSS
jgi:ligand-binding SRPBCC domain-containing protein